MSSSDLRSRLTMASIAGFALLASGCTPPQPEAKEVVLVKPTTGTLSRTLEMVDKDGLHYGTVQLDPLGGGKITDADGRLIGTITPPMKPPQ